MKKLLTLLCCVVCAGAARADFTSYTLVSQSDPLTFDPVVTHTFDSLTINMTGNSAGATNLTVDHHTGAVITLNFTDTVSIIGDTVQLEWIYPTAGTVFESFPAIVVPGTVNLGFGASDFTVTGNTISITNSTQGWTGASFNGFTLIDRTQESKGPSGVPDSGSMLLLTGMGLAGLTGFGLLRRKVSFVSAA